MQDFPIGQENRVDAMKEYELTQGEVKLIIKVDLESSRENTVSFDVKNEEFAYAVAEIWLHVGAQCGRLMGEFDVGNLLESGKTLECLAKHPPDLESVSSEFAVGYLSEWMLKYWESIYADRCTSDSEKRYGVFERALWAAVEQRYLAIYHVHGACVVEGSIVEEAREPVRSWSYFEPEVFSSSIHEILEKIQLDVVRACDVSCQ